MPNRERTAPAGAAAKPKKASKKSTAAAPAAAAQAPAPIFTPPSGVISWRPAREDLYAAFRLQELLGLSTGTQVMRLGLHYALQAVEGCETVDDARRLLGDALVRATSRGTRRMCAPAAPPAVGTPEAPASIAAA